MRIEFRKVVPAREIRSLLLFDRKTFCPADRFPSRFWREIESYWMLVDKVKVGCCGFENHVGFAEEVTTDTEDDHLIYQEGSLYIATTGILPKYQRMGFGQMLKAFQIAHARRKRFERLVTNSRGQNVAMIRLNEKFGFRVTRVIPKYYVDPVDSTVVMQLNLPQGM